VKALSAACLALAVAVALAPRPAAADPVRIDGGLVSGVATPDKKITAFKGIPFAAPPTGELRWRAPQPVVPWKGTLVADRFAPACMQALFNADVLLEHPGPEMATSEDCLYLNLWTPAKAPGARLPVMVWMYGGGNRAGAGSQPAYAGEMLARKGVIVVTFNYRLGALGFLAHPELTKESGHGASGNYALMDDIAVLEWVKKNVASFGGDPSRVTIFGESAGGGHVSDLMGSPRAKGLFQRAIGESIAGFNGAQGPMRTLAQAEQAGVKFAEAQGAASIAALRKKPADELARAPGFGPIVDGWVLPEDLDTVFAAGKQNDVPLLVGSNANEGTPYGQIESADKFIAQAKSRYGDKADDFLKLYPAGNDAEAKESGFASMRDSVFGYQMWTWAKLQAKTGKSPVYYYYFSRTPAFPPDSHFITLGAPPGYHELDPPEKYGAYHSSEVIYAFDNLATRKWPWQKQDRVLADAMSSYWTNFAKTGNPNGGKLPRWPAFDGKNGNEVMHLGDTIAVGPVEHQAGLDFFAKVFAAPPAR
jgi:para-nitrobenzyl esterase